MTLRRASTGRILAAVLFTDMVNSTTVAEELGDRRWKALTARHHAIVRRELKRFGGREIDTAGDGFFATFREPAAAIACACAASEAVRELGIEIRAGIHFGECERMGRHLSGITVVVGARIMALGGAGELLVSATVADLARGAGYGFADRGTHALKGVTGEWRVFEVESVEGVPRARPLDATQAAERRATITPEHARRRIRTPVIVAGVGAAVLAAAAALAFVLTRPPQASPPGPDTIARIDSAGARFGAEAAMGAGAFPDDIAFDGTNLWIANVGNHTLTRLNPDSLQTQVIGTPSAPTGLAVADGRVWVTYGFISDQMRGVGVLDTADAVLGSADVAVPSGSYAIAAGDGAVWIADSLGSSVVRHELASGTTSSIALPAGSGPTSLDIGGGSLWVVAGRQPSVFRISTAKPGEPVERFSTGEDIATAISVAPNGTAWIAIRDADTVLALSSSGTPLLDVSVRDRCDAPTSIEATADAIWVSCSASSNLVRLDPTDGSIAGSMMVVGDPGPMAADGSGAIWVAVREGS
jgi:class 3 adenylate cyclase/streptogramin lyase